MANTDAQNEAIYNGKDDAANTGAGTNNATYLAAAGDVALTPAVQTVVSGTAYQFNAKRQVDVYVQVTTAASLKIEYGPTSACATTLNAAQSNTLGLSHITLPAGWYIKFTGTVADFVVTTLTR